MDAFEIGSTTLTIKIKCKESTVRCNTTIVIYIYMYMVRTEEGADADTDLIMVNDIIVTISCIYLCFGALLIMSQICVRPSPPSAQ